MRAILSNAQLCATRGVNHPFVQCIHAGYDTACQSFSKAV